MAPQQRRSSEVDMPLIVQDQNGHQNENVDEIQPNVGSSYYYLQSSTIRQSLINYQYQGEDRSQLYRLILSPLASFCVNRITPSSIAPNTITLVGLIFMTVSYCFMWYYVPSLKEQHAGTTDNESFPLDIVPRWIFLYNAFSILIYQTLDNMDGKQARKTGSSSPLGLLFDHGCDAVNSLFGSVNWIITMGLNPHNDNFDLLLCCIMLFGPYALFYVGTWEEYYTGKLILPLFNGPNEGLLGAALVSLASYYYGPSYWHTSSWWNAICDILIPLVGDSFDFSKFTLRNADLLILASSIGFIQELSTKVYYVVTTYHIRAVSTLLPFVTLATSYIIIGVTTFKTDENGQNYMFWTYSPRTSVHLCAILFVEMVTDLMLCHMTKQKYSSIRWILVPLIIGTLWIVFGTTDSSLEYYQDILLIYVAVGGTFLVMKIQILIHEMCTLLNIWCFDIVTPRSSRQPLSDANGSENYRIKKIE